MSQKIPFRLQKVGKVLTIASELVQIKIIQIFSLLDERFSTFILNLVAYKYVFKLKKQISLSATKALGKNNIS